MLQYKYINLPVTHYYGFTCFNKADKTSFLRNTAHNIMQRARLQGLNWITELFIFCNLLGLVYSSHFRGALIQWRPVDNSGTVSTNLVVPLFMETTTNHLAGIEKKSTHGLDQH